jgi:hypothetical protein
MGGGRAIARLVTLAGGFVVGAALAAITLIPFLELLTHSIDFEERSGGGLTSHEPPRYLVEIFLHDWWGRGSRVALEYASSLEEHAYYVGALTLMLAGAALVFGRRRERIVVAAVGALALAVSAGIQPFFAIVDHLPGFDAARNGRLAVFAVLSVAVLAGWGLDDLSSAQISAGRRRLVVAIAGAIFLLPLVYAAARHAQLSGLGSAIKVAWAFKTPPRDAPGVVRLASVLEWVVLAGAALVLLVLRLRDRLSTPAFVALAALLVALDLFKAGMGYNPAIATSDAVQPTTPAIRFLQSQRPQRFAGLHPEAPLSFAVPLPPNVAMRYGLIDARGYDFPVEQRYAKLWQRVIAQSPNCNYAFCPESAGRSPAALKALGLLGVTELLQSRRDPPLRALRTAYAGPDARVYANPGALPRAFLVDRQEVVGSGDAALLRVASPDFTPRTVAVTERPLAGLSAGAGSPGAARVTHYGGERVVVHTTARRSALLVLTDTWYPGWKATVDGRDAGIERVDYLIRGVRVPAGAHTVAFRYEPTSWRAGWIVSLLALAAIAGATAVGVRARRRGDA